MRALFTTILLVLAVDQASKFWILEVLDLNSRSFVPVWPPYLNFHMAWNTGVNFGLLGGADLRWPLIALALVVSALVAIWVLRARAGRLGLISAGLLIGGALGNVIDRLRFGAVVDFLNMSCCDIVNPFAFNIADVAVFAGAFGLLFFAPNSDRKAA